MGPYRQNGPSRRSGRAQIDHDVFEGLPVRNWRRQSLTVGVPPKTETSNNRNYPTELPMPKDSHMLCPMSRALLQAARAGRINKLPPLSEVEVKENAEQDEGDKIEADRVFSTKRWQHVPRHLEGPEIEYLAKRRKGLRAPSQNGVLGPTAGGGVVKRATVRKTDVEGNSLVEEVIVTEGQKVEGEIISEVTMTDVGAPGTVLDGVGVVNAHGVVVAADVVQPTPPRRRPPPPRRKPKGWKKGRKKQVQFKSGTEGAEGASVNQPENVVSEETSGEGVVRPEGEQDRGAEGADVEMGDDSNLQDGEEDEDEGDDVEEGEEGEEGDDEDREEGEDSVSTEAVGSASPSKSSVPAPAMSVAEQPPAELSHPLPPKPAVAVSSVETSHELPPKPPPPEEDNVSSPKIPSPKVPSPTDPSPKIPSPKIASPAAEAVAVEDAPESLKDEVQAPPPAESIDAQAEDVQISDDLLPPAPTTNSKASASPAMDSPLTTPRDSPLEPAAETLDTVENQVSVEELPQETSVPLEPVSILSNDNVDPKPASPTDGGVDLLGSLEKHLDGQGVGESEPSTAQADQSVPEQEEDNVDKDPPQESG